jgi:solute carrier family 9B (sodium/hydrogen exchanger), member 1/2
MGTVVAAVSPAIIVPKMLKLMETRYGKSKCIPQLIITGASVDDVFVIVLFSIFTGLAQSSSFSPINFLSLPTAIILGFLSGIIAGLLLSFIFTKFHIRDTSKVIIILSVSFLLISLDYTLSGIIRLSGLLAVITMGVSIKKKKNEVSKRLSKKFTKLWIASELILFVLVGASFNFKNTFDKGFLAILLIFGIIIFRVAGVFISLIKTKLNYKERTFISFSYIPKATVQAALGGLPIAMGLSSGNIILTVAVISIIISAPLGAFLIDKSYKFLLSKD